MKAITKSKLAENLGVSRARISQYVKSGLPVRADGHIDLDAALKWVRANVEPDYNGGGAAEAANRSHSARNTDEPNPVEAAVDIALGVLFSIIPSTAQTAAREAGADENAIEKIPAIAHRLAVAAANDLASTFFSRPPREWPDLDFCKKCGPQ